MIDLTTLDELDALSDNLGGVRARASNVDRPLVPNKDTDNQDDLLTTMLITANVGTIFEESSLLELWFKQLKTYLIVVRPQFVSIHCQEVGGKNFVNSMKYMSIFTDKIIGDQDIADNYNRIRLFLDEDYKNLERFTALGSIYLVHNTVKNFKIYNFETNNFDTLQDISVNSFNQDNFRVQHVEKVKFPQDLFPEARLSRKGFMRTRWLFNDRQMLDLVNIHLFHDASNLVAMEATPSPYALDRQRALDFTLRKISEPLKISDVILNECQKFYITRNQKSNQTISPDENSSNLQVPLFIFGDFNFRLDTKKVIERISRGASPKIKRCANSNEVLQFVYHLDDQQSLECSSAKVEESPQYQYRRTSSISNPEVVTRENSSSSSRHAQQCPIPLTPSRRQKQFGQAIAKQEQELGESELGSCIENFSDYGGAGTPANTPVVMTIGKKLFDFVALDETFRATENNEWLQEMDNELNSFRSELFEFKISFSPSYPFKEDTSGAYSYMKTRCPAWCDRILFNSAGSKVIHSRQDNEDPKTEANPERKQAAAEEELKARIREPEQGESQDRIDVIRERVELLQNEGDIQYRLLGNSSPMGDHKPVLLYCQLAI